MLMMILLIMRMFLQPSPNFISIVLPYFNDGNIKFYCNQFKMLQKNACGLNAIKHVLQHPARLYRQRVDRQRLVQLVQRLHHVERAAIL